MASNEPNHFQITKGDQPKNQSDFSKSMNVFGSSWNADSSKATENASDEMSTRAGQSAATLDGADIAVTTDNNPVSGSRVTGMESSAEVETNAAFFVSSAFVGPTAGAANAVFGGGAPPHAFTVPPDAQPPAVVPGEQRVESTVFGSQSTLAFGATSNPSFTVPPSPHSQPVFGATTPAAPAVTRPVAGQPAIFGGQVSTNSCSKKWQKPPAVFGGQLSANTADAGGAAEKSTNASLLSANPSFSALSSSAFRGPDTNPPKAVFAGAMFPNTFTTPAAAAFLDARTDFKSQDPAPATDFGTLRESASDAFIAKHPMLGVLSNKDAFADPSAIPNTFNKPDITLPNVFGGQVSSSNTATEPAIFGGTTASNAQIAGQVPEVANIFGGNIADVDSAKSKPSTSLNLQGSKASTFGGGASLVESRTAGNGQIASKDGTLNLKRSNPFTKPHDARGSSSTQSGFRDTFNKNVLPLPPDAGNLNIKPFSLRSALFTGKNSASESVRSASKQRDVLDEILAVKKHQVVSPVKKNATTLIAIDVPQKYLKKEILKTHFEKFGIIKRLLINEKSQQALIYFTDHLTALNAKNNGKSLHPNLPEMKLLFKAPPVSGTKDLLSAASLPIERKDRTALAARQSKDQPRAKPRRSASPATAITSKGSTSSAGEVSIPSAFTHDPLATKANTSLSLERHALLDARDKAMRHKQDKVCDVRKAQYLAASCPDMCPEKERYIRHVQNDLSSFELTDGQLDHRLAVKQFSRSSADKEEPLPYELRPGPVLRLTMDFLLCNIVEALDPEQPEVWYNYMWNRTRALRNDLMQQHLVDQHAVHVLERCIRFHIHCRHEFCESASDMDPKMNDEHLGKSLQSLRDAYHDLGELNEFCACEPEFRGYDILLNLGHGDISLRYQQFSAAVRSSPPVRYAIKVSYAFHANNYVKFFQLTQAASYLQGCILHKYYKVVRKNALVRIVRAYTLPNITQQLSRHRLQLMLGMPDDAQLTELLENYGFALSAADSTVTIVRAKVMTAEAYVLRQDPRISARRKCPVSEVINGGILPPNPLAAYRPHTSFTEAGALTERARDARDQAASRKPLVVKSPVNALDALEKRLLHRATVIYEMNLMRKSFHAWSRHARIEKAVRRGQRLRSLRLQRSCYARWRSVVERRARANQVADNFYAAIFLRKWRQFVAGRRAMRLYRGEVARRMRRDLTAKYVRTWRRAVARAKRARKMTAVRRQFLRRKYVMAWQAIVITARVMRQANAYYERSLVAKTFATWRHWLMTRQHRRDRLHRDYPAVASSLPVQRQNDQWHWGYERAPGHNLSVIQVTRLGSVIERSLRRAGVSDADTFFERFPLADWFQRHIDSRAFTPKLFNQFIKVRIYISRDLDPQMAAWIRAKFSLSGERNVSRLNESLTLHSRSGNKCQFNIVIVESREIFASHDPLSITIAFSSIIGIRLVQAQIEASRPANMLLICESGRTELRSHVWQLCVDTMNGAHVADCFLRKIFAVWQGALDNSPMRRAPCDGAFNAAFTSTVLHPVQKIVNQRAAFGCYRMPPSIVLSMYNEFVDHFVACVQQHGLHDLLPEEILNDSYFSSTCDNYGATIDTLKALRLPALRIKEDTLWAALLEEISTYCDTFGEEWNDDIKSEIFYVLQSVKENISHHNDVVDILSIPWIDIIFRLVSYKMAALDSSIVIYDSQLLANFRPTEDYLSYLKIFTGPPLQKSPIEVSSEVICRANKRKTEDDATLNSSTKKNKSSLLQNLSTEAAKMKELELILQREIDLVNTNIQLLSKV